MMPFRLFQARSTGDRDITSLLSGVSSGRLILCRDDSTVWLDFQDLDVRGIGGSFAFWDGVFPHGLQPRRDVDLVISNRTLSDFTSTVRIYPSGRLVIYRHSRDLLRGLVSFRTKQAMPAPSDYPGIEVA